MNQNLDIKICGLSTKEAIDAVIEGGASHMGFIFFEKSPRHISLAQALLLADHAGNRIKKVPVTVNADDTYLDLIVEAVKPDMLQLHGSETPERVFKVKERFGLPIMKAIAIREASDLEKVTPYLETVDQFVFDAKPPAAKKSGCTAIDISSGVESAPGIKDVKLIKEFLETCSSI